MKELKKIFQLIMHQTIIQIVFLKTIKIQEMITNYFKIAIRNIIRQKGFSFINIFGLTLGIASALLIFLWVFDEVTFDKFHTNIKQIYRVEQGQYYNGEVYHVNVTPYPSGEGWKQEIPEIEDAIRFAYTGNLLLKYEENSFFESGIAAVDSTIFDVFSFPLSLGNQNEALTKPYSMVLTKEIAEKYFGQENPLGKIIRVDNQYEFTVTGVLKEIPNNSSIRFKILVPFDFCKTLGYYSDHWGSNSIQTFVKLKSGSDPKPVDKKLTDVVKSHIEFDDDETESDYKTQFMIAPLQKLHLHSYFGFGHSPGQVQLVYIFITIGIFILLIACINFMNLSTARSTKRAREIGVRKVSGAHRENIILQFFGESITTTIIAAIFSLIIVILLLSKFNQLSGKEIPVDFLKSLEFVFGLITIIIATGLIAGIYPALFLSKFKPVKVLKGELSDTSSKGNFRKILVIIQFTLSIFLIVGTFIIYKQLNFMQNQKLGYNKEHIVYIRMFGDINKSYNVINNAFKTNSVVENVTCAAHLPSNIGSNSGGVDWEGKDPNLTTLVSMSIVDFGYTETLNIPIIQGRSFSEDFPSDRANDSIGGFVINEELLKIINVENPVGMRFSFMGVSEGRIIGVMKNFHFYSMRSKIEPLAIAVGFDEWLRYIIIRVKPGNIPETVEKLTDTWNSVMPQYPFEYHFLNDEYDRMYKSEERMGSLIKYFAIIAILIASLGLFGLVSFMAEKRTKEIGIRKAMGSSAMQIIFLLSKDFTRLVFVAIIIAIPVSWYFIEQWLQDYAYKTDLSWWIFALAAVLSLVIAILTVSYQAFKASNTNPARTLRYE
ncbi:MAG: ABC transporter permease [Bacteroidales bacterium]|nr:ABC transporter permease [Bacteroidales bacterium]